VYEETAGLTVGDVVTRTKKVRAGVTVVRFSHFVLQALAIATQVQQKYTSRSTAAEHRACRTGSVLVHNSMHGPFVCGTSIAHVLVYG
jgi:hypothetical protein